MFFELLLVGVCLQAVVSCIKSDSSWHIPSAWHLVGTQQVLFTQCSERMSNADSLVCPDSWLHLPTLWFCFLSSPFSAFLSTAAGSLSPQCPLQLLQRWTNLIPCQILAPRVCNSVHICWIEANWYHNSVLRRVISQGSRELNQRAASKVSFLLNYKSKLGWDM